jgi:phage baseplate assembly protein W
MLFGTRPGERIYLPQYGLNMEALVYEPLDETMIADAQTAIKTSVESYIPTVLVVQVQVNQDNNNNQVSFAITMQVRGSTPNDLLTYSTPSTPSV